MGKNKHTLPHPGPTGGREIDVRSEREGETNPQKFHEIIQGPNVDPKSVEGLRQRLKSRKGY